MPRRVKLNLVAVAAATGLLWVFFNLTKHLPPISDMAPFLDDPFDAVGSFAVVASLLLLALAAFRTLRRYPAGRPDASDHIYAASSQLCLPVMIGVTLAADGVAMARDPGAWLGQPAGWLLLALMVALMLLASAVGDSVVRAGAGQQPARRQSDWLKVGAWALGGALGLWIYPARASMSVPVALATVIVGALILFSNTGAWVEALLPAAAPRPLRRRSQAWTIWLVVAAAGAGLGALAFLAELLAEPGPGMGPGPVIIALIFVGLMVAGLLIGLAFLGTVLGLWPGKPSPTM